MCHTAVMPTESGVAKVTVRIPPDLHRRLRQVVFDQDTSIQAEVANLIVMYVEHHEGQKVVKHG